MPRPLTRSGKSPTFSASPTSPAPPPRRSSPRRTVAGGSNINPGNFLRGLRLRRADHHRGLEQRSHRRGGLPGLPVQPPAERGPAQRRRLRDHLQRPRRVRARAVPPVRPPVADGPDAVLRLLLLGDRPELHPVPAAGGTAAARRAGEHRHEVAVQLDADPQLHRPTAT